MDEGAHSTITLPFRIAFTSLSCCILAEGVAAKPYWSKRASRPGPCHQSLPVPWASFPLDLSSKSSQVCQPRPMPSEAFRFTLKRGKLAKTPKASHPSSPAHSPCSNHHSPPSSPLAPLFHSSCRPRFSACTAGYSQALWGYQNNQDFIKASSCIIRPLSCTCMHHTLKRVPYTKRYTVYGVCHDRTMPW